MNMQTDSKPGFTSFPNPPSTWSSRALSIPIVILLAVFSLGTFSCDNSFGILGSIQKETKQTGTNVFLAGTVKNVVSDGTVYFAQMAKIYSRKVSDLVGTDTWKVLAVKTATETFTDYVCTGLTSDTRPDSLTVFAVLCQRVSGELIGIYKTTDSGANWTDTGSSGIPAGSYIQSVFYVKDTLFASIRKLVSGTNVYDLLYHDGTVFKSASSTMLPGGIPATEVVNPFLGGEWDGTNYRFIQAGAIYSGTSASAISADTGTGIVDKTFKGICADPADNDVYVSTDDGFVYKRAASDSTWAGKQVTSKVSLGTLAVIPASTVAGGPGIRLSIARYDSVYGYLEYDWESGTEYSGSGGELVTSESNYSTTLSGKPVLSFYLSQENRMFATGIASNLTGYGMYSSIRNPITSSWGGWAAE